MTWTAARDSREQAPAAARPAPAQAARTGNFTGHLLLQARLTHAIVLNILVFI